MVGDDPFNNLSWNGPRHVRYGGRGHPELVSFQFDGDFQPPCDDGRIILANQAQPLLRHRALSQITWTAMKVVEAGQV